MLEALCQKCIDAIRQAGYSFAPPESGRVIRQIVVSESKCEFWAHQDLRGYKKRVRGYQKLVDDENHIVHALDVK